VFAIGECDYQFHGANRLGANSLVACIFSGLAVAPGVMTYLNNLPAGGRAADQSSTLFERAAYKHLSDYKSLLARPTDGPNPYKLHLELGALMTKNVTVVRHNPDLESALGRLEEIAEQVKVCALADKSGWLNQNLVFVRALGDMMPMARAIVKGALRRDECRGAHYKPEFAMPDIKATAPAERRREAEAWCDRFEANNQKWLKTTVADCQPDGGVSLRYEDVDTSLIPPRPRLYGIVGGQEIEEVWKTRRRGEGRGERGE
jgi:succinate dehydrogenase / fumarate reductase flavoprotein subunit